MIYQLRDVVKIRASGETEFRLIVPELVVHQGEKVALVGPSGCGKSTLLDLLALVLSPSMAEVFRFTAKGVSGIDLATIWSGRQFNKLSELRKHHVGYILQTGGLLPYISVRENIALSCRLLAMSEDGLLESLAAELGIGSHLDKLPCDLSVGERQRVAIARALIHRPSVVVADEPTASLDPHTAEKVMTLFVRLVEELGLTVIVASHDSDFLRKLGLRPLRQRFVQTGAVSVSEFAG